MSVQFGRWNYDNAPPALGRLEKASQLLAPYGPDGEGRYSGPGVDIIYRGFHTTQESRRETQPHAVPSGTVFTWDGRLDNREELIPQLSGELSDESTDAAIVAGAYERWGTNSFAKFIGDWALSIWNPREHALILTKDFIGLRRLYYTADEQQVTWSTILDPLVLLSGKTFQLEEEYIAGWLSYFPATHLTPYVGIHAVPPSAFVCLRRGKETVTKYWDFDPHKKIRYGSDGEYEEHFRAVFRESVRRRLRSDSPVLAELSGGMDSSSIVCMADRILARGGAETPRLDTVSYYDESEPNWNERPYFTKVEEQRGRAGCHIDVGCNNVFAFEREDCEFAATPSAVGRPSKASQELSNFVHSQGSKVLLSGIGGDEVLGGVPTPIPELADLLATGRFVGLAHQLKAWALSKRQPWFHLLLETAQAFCSSATARAPNGTPPARWLKPDFVRRHRPTLNGYAARFKLIGSTPSFQESLLTLDALKRQLECAAPVFAPLFERRYPYLDRHLLEFLYAVPRQQIIRPGERRSLMRRALAETVPAKLLERRRKGFLSRSAAMTIPRLGTATIHQSRDAASALLGILVPGKFFEELEKAGKGQEVPTVPIVRTLLLGIWLRSLSSVSVNENSQLRNSKSKGGENDELLKAANPVVLRGARIN